MSKLNRKERRAFCLTKSIKDICELPLTWYIGSIIYKKRRYRAERLRLNKLLPPTKCPLDAFLCMKAKLLAAG